MTIKEIIIEVFTVQKTKVILITHEMKIKELDFAIET